MPSLILMIVASRRLLPLAAFFTSLLALPAGADDTQAAISGTRPPSLTVAVDAVRREFVATTVAGTGVVEPWQEVAIGAETSGLVLADVAVAEGDRVAKGEVIARLDGALLEAQMAEQDGAIRSAAAQLADARAATERATQLARTGNITAETVQERTTALQTAAAALDQAEAKRRTLGVQVERTRIRAPFAGIVSAKPAVAGGVVQVGTEIARLQRDGALEAKLEIPETRLGRIATGDPATLVAPDGSSVEASVSSISETVDATTHLATVSVRLPAEPKLKAGMLVSGTIRVKDDVERLTVAAGALTWSGAAAGVFVVADDGTVSRRAVRTGERTGERVVVTGELRGGETLATAGAGFLNEGDRVSVAQESALVSETAR